mgnify:FL=1
MKASRNKRSAAQKASDQRYVAGLKRIVLDVPANAPILARLDRLAQVYGSKKAAIIAGLYALPDNG